MKLKDFDFRIWDNHHIGCSNRDCKCKITKYVYGEVAKIRLSEFKEDCEIELWTGLYDKNNQKIYEGDILYSFEDCPEDEGLIYVVKFKNGAFYLVEPEDIDSVGEQGNVIYCPEEFEVVGNIHENQDLINIKE